MVVDGAGWAALHESQKVLTLSGQMICALLNLATPRNRNRNKAILILLKKFVGYFFMTFCFRIKNFLKLLTDNCYIVIETDF